MKNRIQYSARYISAGVCLLLSLLANHAGAAAPYFWDPQGTWGTIPPAYTGNLSGTWEASSWATAAAGQASGVAWPETGLAACFAVGAGNGTPAFTMTMNNSHTVAGIVDGSRTSPNACNVTINGPGILTLPAGTMPVFNVANSVNDGSLGLVTINAVIAGSGSGMTVLGNGQLFLHGANTFTGGTVLGNSGSINFNNAGAFGTGSIVISNASSGIGTMIVEGSSALAITNAVTVATNASVNIVGNPAGLTFSGPWSLPYAANIGSGVAGSPVIVSGVMSGAGGFNKFNPGTLKFTALNTYTGNTTVSNGVLQLGDGVSLNGTVGGTIGIWNLGSLIFANPTALTYSKVISGTGPVTYQGPGILTLSGASTYSGTTTISAGTVKLGVANALPSGVGKGDVSLAGTLDLASLACSVNGLNGAGTVDSSTGTGSTLTAGNGDANGTFSGIITNTSGTNALTKVGLGTLTLSGANTYAGLTTVSAGTLQVGVNNALPAGSSVLVSGGATLNMNSHSDTITALGGAGSVINNNGTLTVNGNANAAGSQNFNGYSCIAGVLTGSGSLVKDGTHAMAVRTNLSSYSGPITLSGGTLSVGAAPNRLPTGIALSVPSGATFQLDANNQTVSTLNGSGSVNLGGGVLTVNQGGSDSFSGSLRNSEVFNSSTALGHGLRGYYYANIDFTGLATVRDDSTVNLADMSAMPGYSASTKTNQISVRWLGQVLTTIAGDYVFTTRCDDGARLWVNGVLVVDDYILHGATSKSGTNTLAANTKYDIIMEFFNNTSVGSAQLYWTPPGDLSSVIIPSSNLLLSGPGSLVKSGTGVQQLTVASTYSGGTTVSAGTLDATADGALGRGNVSVAAGANAQLDSSATINAAADVILAASAHNVYLNFSGQNDIHAISLNGGATYGPAGTYGSTTSTATYQYSVFTGDGILNVTAGPSANALTCSPPSPATVVYGSPVTLTATITGSAPTPTGTVTFYDGTTLLGTNVTIISGVATLSVSNLQVTTSPHSLTAVYSGDSSHARSISSAVSVSTTVATVTPIPVIVTKPYDGTTNATIASGTFGGILPSDTNYVHISGTSYTAYFSTPYVGTNKTVSITGLALSGSLSGDYVLSTTSVSTTGSITNRTVTISGLTATNRVYDANTDDGVTGAPVLNNVLAGDTVTLGGSPVAAFTTKAAGTAKPVTLSGYTIGGPSATNYILVMTNLSANITAYPVAVTGLSANNKVYDGGTNATLLGSALASFFAGDSVAIIGTPVAFFNSPTVGDGKPVTVTGYTLTGSDAPSYSLSQPTDLSASITPAATTATIISSLNPSTNGNSVTFTFKVTSTTPTTNPPTGLVTFKTNTVAVIPTVALVSNTPTSATAVFTTALLPIGTDPVQGVYPGDANFSAPAAPTVNQVVQGIGVCSQTNRVLSVTALGGGSFTLNLIGTYQAQYRILSQTNVAQPSANWLPVFGGTNTVTNPSGLWSVTVTNRAPAFFRSQAMSGVCP
jgi:autotransporter-associated beta strand protein